MDDLSGDTEMQVSVSHGTKSSMYAWSFSDAVLCRASWAAMDRSSAYKYGTEPGVIGVKA